jgi:hypothetical protein
VSEQVSADAELAEAREAVKRVYLFGTQEEIVAAEARIEAARERQGKERVGRQRDRIVELITPWCRSKEDARLAADKLIADKFRSWPELGYLHRAMEDLNAR